MTDNTEYKTLAALSVNVGDVVEFKGGSKYTVKQNKTLWSHQTGLNCGYLSNWSTVNQFKVLSRANPEIRVGETYKDNLGTEWKAIYSEGDNVWMKEFDSGAAYVWTKGGQSISLNTRYDINLGPVIEEEVHVSGPVYLDDKGHHVFNATVTTKDGVPDWSTLKIKEEGVS